MAKISSIEDLNKKIIRCRKCPRLYSYIRNVAHHKVKRFLNEKYWGKPLPGFGDLNGRVLIVGLAPAAHGGNRTGRMFTGDSSGDWVAKVLYENGFATKPTSENVNDGFELVDCYITAVVRCAPPQNKPTKDELDTCSDYLIGELTLLENIQVVVCLGRIAYEVISDILQIKRQKFYHGQLTKHQNLFILSSYHPSRQNTQTGRLTWDQWNRIFVMAKKLIS